MLLNGRLNQRENILLLQRLFAVNIKLHLFREEGLAMTSIFDIEFWGTLKKKLKEDKQ